MLVKKILMAIFGVATVFTSEIAAANTQHNDASKFMPDISEVVSATIVLTPPGMMTRAPLTENKLLEFGCNYTEDRKKINDLINSIKNNVKYDEAEAGQFYLRNAIYLNLRNGSKIRYSFGDDFNKSKKIFGGSDDGSTGSYTPFLTQNALLIDLRKWILDDSVEKKTVQWCLEHK